jgi:A/G-specific adenine glycosylase
MQDFSSRLVQWQKRHGRHDLPWQNTRDPYRVWLSEIMLQQTQVAAVIPYYQRFLERFPDIRALAAASEDDVLTLWSGLGYYSRARNLHRAAGLVVDKFDGSFPTAFDDIVALPGIGRSTAAAISVFAFGRREAILDGNVKRVLARVFGIAGYPGEKQVETTLWREAEALLPHSAFEPYTQGLMDLGATVCTRTRPGCGECPVAALCFAHREGRTAAFPQPKPRKVLPEKSVVMLLVRHEGDICLEKRPAAGIWGGMWSLPEVEATTDLAAYCGDRFGAAPELLAPMPVLTHTFTHFRLHITPQPLALNRLPMTAAEPGMVWLPLEDALGAAIPTPVRKLIAGIIKQA